MRFLSRKTRILLSLLQGRSTRDANGAWDPSINATAIMNYLQSRYAGATISWSLGNEPGVWQAPYNVSDAQVRVDSQLGCCHEHVFFIPSL